MAVFEDVILGGRVHHDVYASGMHMFLIASNGSIVLFKNGSSRCFFLDVFSWLNDQS